MVLYLCSCVSLHRVSSCCSFLSGYDAGAQEPCCVSKNTERYNIDDYTKVARRFGDLYVWFEGAGEDVGPEINLEYGMDAGEGVVGGLSSLPPLRREVLHRAQPIGFRVISSL